MDQMDKANTNGNISPAPSAVEMALYIYLSRKMRILEAAEDEAEYRSLLSSFQKAAKELGRQAKAVFYYNEDTDQRIRAKEVLDELKADLDKVCQMGFAFMRLHEEAHEAAAADAAADCVLDTLQMSGRIEATLVAIKNGRDGRLSQHQEQLEALAFAGPAARDIHKRLDDLGVRQVKPYYAYPVKLPPLGEKVPEFPLSFQRFLELPPEDLELAENGTLQIPPGYTDAEGNDLTNLWRVDWDREEVSAGLTDEETQNGSVKWKVFIRERPGLQPPAICDEYLTRLCIQLLGPRPGEDISDFSLYS